jgi:hypothetical protein
MGSGEYLLFASWQRVFHLHLHPAGAENENLDLVTVERLGIIGDACRMHVMVGAKKKLSLFHALNSLQGYDFFVYLEVK